MNITKYGRFSPLFLLPLFAGCAKSPSGGAANPQAPNRLTVQMQLQQPVNNAFLYAFAFDDDDQAADGPQAIIGTSQVANNGIVAGSFTVLVVYENGQYLVYRRTAGANGSETLDRASRAFVTQPSPVVGNTFRFTLDLDAVTDSGVPLFRAGTQRLDVNFVTTNERRRAGNQAPRTAFDAFGPRAASAYGTFRILGASRFEYSNANTVGEPTNDVQTDDTTNSVNLAQLDITDFSVLIERS